MLVWNHMAGEWLVMHWWTDDERGHLVFAKDEKTLRQLARAVFKEHTDAEVRAVLRIEMVAPSDKMEHIAREHDEIERADTFYFEILARLKEVLEAGKPLPPPFALCTRYQSSVDEPVVVNAEDHWDCINCSIGLVSGMTKRELLAKYQDRWDKTFNTSKRAQRLVKTERPRPTRVKSRAVKATDDESLLFALANFGHHAGGVELHEVDMTDSENYRPRCLSDNALFFYRLVTTEESLRDELSGLVEKARSCELEAMERRDEKRRAERHEERSRQVDAVVAFFAES